MPEHVVALAETKCLRTPSRKRHASKAFTPIGTVFDEHLVALMREAMSRREARAWLAGWDTLFTDVGLLFGAMSVLRICCFQVKT